MNEIPQLNTSRSQSVIRASAILLLIVGAITTACFLVEFVLSFLLPIAIIVAIAVLVWWIIRKMRGNNNHPNREDLQNAAHNIVGQASGMVDKGVRAGMAATAAIRKEWKR